MQFQSRIILAALSLSILGGSSVASATVTGFAYGAFSNPVGGDSGMIQTISNLDGNLTAAGSGNAVFTWGFNNCTGCYPNTFSFDGTGSGNHASGFSVPAYSTGSIFYLGLISYYNGTTTVNPNGVTLDIGVSLPSISNTANTTFTLNLGITPDTTGYGSDKVSITNALNPVTFVDAGRTYTLTLLGFNDYDTKGNPIFVNSTSYYQGYTTVNSHLYGMISDSGNVVVPLPLAAFLFPSGLAALGWVGRCRNKNLVRRISG